MGLWRRLGFGAPGGGAGPSDKEFGKKGEDIAASYLSRHGYAILEKNYRTRSGEVDIIAMDGPTLVFVEVKARRSDSFGTPGEAVNARKRKQIERAALNYVIKNNKDGLHCRFDVVAVTVVGGGGPNVELIKDAFELSGGYRG